MSSEAINTSVRRRRLRETMGKVIIVALGLTAASFFLTSCGVKKSLNPNSTSSANGARSYLPIQTGYSATFSVTDTIGQEIRQESFSATSGSSFQGREGVRWEGQNLTDTTIATGGVLFWDDQGVYLQADGASAAEVLLASPLEKGADWPRWRDFSAPVIIDVGAGSLVLDSSASGLGVNIGGGANGNEPTFSSSFPTS
ncbi:MAG: hypothetical protein ACE5GA_02825, partial [Candidatus Zixiibacteriota bacterium]